jgi:hypothetical protein
MPTAVHVNTLPPFSNMRTRCPKCGAGRKIRVHFDRGCAEVDGKHMHHRWLEQTYEWFHPLDMREHP